jgi:hypothetical protein
MLAALVRQASRLGSNSNNVVAGAAALQLQQQRFLNVHEYQVGCRQS